MIPPGSIDSLVAHLRGLSSAERSAYLEQACIDNPDLRENFSEIRSALEMDAQPEAASAAAGASAEGALRAFNCALENNGRETEGSRIGPYKLFEKIGEGGFGVVWMAEQQEPIRRRVALKIIKLGMDTREVIVL